jgi:hypothetical protein
MDVRFLGLPLFLWGFLCLVVAAIFTIVWPGQGSGATGARLVLLRWGHAGVWLLLALFCFARGAGLRGPVGLLGLAAGLLYLAFLAALVRE